MSLQRHVTTDSDIRIRYIRLEAGTGFFLWKRVGIGGRVRRFGLRFGVRIGFGMHGVRHGHELAHGFFKGEFAFTAVAAMKAFVAKMIGARILGAAHADSRGFFAADAASKRHGFGYFPFFRAGGVSRDKIPRQRWAS